MTRERIVPYLPRLFGYALSLTLDRETARELVQDCAVNALRARRVPRDEPAFRAWLFVILRNALLDRNRSFARQLAALADAAEEAAAPFVDWHYDETLINAISVRSGLARLAPAQREILALVDISGFSYAETAGILGVPAGTVMSRLARARRALLDSLAESNVHALPPRQSRRAR